MPEKTLREKFDEILEDIEREFQDLTDPKKNPSYNQTNFDADRSKIREQERRFDLLLKEIDSGKLDKKTREAVDKIVEKILDPKNKSTRIDHVNTALDVILNAKLEKQLNSIKDKNVKKLISDINVQISKEPNYEQRRHLKVGLSFLIRDIQEKQLGKTAMNEVHKIIQDEWNRENKAKLSGSFIVSAQNAISDVSNKSSQVMHARAEAQEAKSKKGFNFGHQLEKLTELKKKQPSFKEIKAKVQSKVQETFQKKKPRP